MLLAQVEDERVPESVAENVVKGVAGLAFVERDHLAVRSDMDGLVAVRELDLDVVVLADEALRDDGLLRALSGSGRERDGTGGDRGGSEESGEDGEEGEDLHDVGRLRATIESAANDGNERRANRRHELR